mmetsp:Transcript_2741/g.4688  ORF Transcript_2741/g.4688 Transcript_2741/m.4688 type:complete len:88 (+) Transcript_2741:60-323(+)|eukprot:CAMPEP_0168607380 /NCGR_PEP_ID=MMETSP0449_2-20121227/4_1 /TAXON_ID=1082188 /ORGANISM="Strombidium rassoulzadegani, Strain ras09" /LENGTH=87 /DNA_ID=CAMNT_0008647177 /DNA_START=39 /DNA_END=302 /DNA_ORIENTATION=+
MNRTSKFFQPSPQPHFVGQAQAKFVANQMPLPSHKRSEKIGQEHKDNDIRMAFAQIPDIATAEAEMRLNMNIWGISKPKAMCQQVNK